MATVIRSSLRGILSAIKAQIISGVPLPAARVLVSVRKQVPHFQADQDVVIRPRGFKIEKIITDQVGRWETTLRRRIDFTCRTRLGVDESDRDESWLQHASFGHILLEEKVVDAMQEFFPADASGNHLVREPMLLTDGLDPDKEQDDELVEWGQSTVSFDVVYDLAFTELPT